MTSALRNWSAYGQIVTARFRMAVTYRLNTMFALALIVLQIFALRQVWTALYAGRDTVADLGLQPLLAYITIANLQNFALQDPSISAYMHARVREGQVAFDLLRPAGFVPQMLAHLAGSSLVMGAFIVVALPLVAVVGVLQLPPSLPALGYWALSLLFGYAVAILLNLIVGLMAFWTTEISGITLMYYLVSQFLAGALVPLNLFPDALRTAAALLPFQATTYAPTAIYVGQRAGADALGTIGVQALWVVLLSVLAGLVWGAARRRVVVQGG